MKVKMKFKKLLERGRIGNMEIKNRIVMAPMGTALSDEQGCVTKEMEAFYEARAKGGVGLIIVENASVDFPQGRQRKRALCIDGARTQDGLSRLNEAIHRHGAKTAIQLHHAGRIAKSHATGLQPLAPSAIAAPGGEMPRELSKREIAAIVERFARAALLSKQTGFDGIEIHGAHHYLLAQFLSRASNHRTDSYGGSLENRIRLLLEVLEAVRMSVGSAFPVWCRINGAELGMENGWTQEEALTLAVQLERAGIDALSVSAFGYGKFKDTIKPERECQLLPYAAAVKKKVSKPVMTAGMITPVAGESILQHGQADWIAIGRGLLTDPELSLKVSSGQPELIRPCICCGVCDDSRAAGGSIRCCVNAATGRESQIRIEAAKEPKKVWIIGGGPAGMEAARVAALRGHHVRLYEKEQELGGQLRFASAAPHKGKLRNLKDFFTNQLKKLRVEEVLGEEVTASMIRAARPDAVVIASGATEAPIALFGNDQIPFYTAKDVLAETAEIGEKVVIFGGGMVGCDVAQFLLEKGKKVFIVGGYSPFASRMRPTVARKVQEKFSEAPITIFERCRCVGVIERECVCRDVDGKETIVEADTVVVATGFVADNRLFQSLSGKIPNLFHAGDCIQPRTLVEAIDEGMQVGLAL
jgi:2,4-dienoyl-CoA reductase-like NADH-dependent reductase (Old Yellow Enzyme family)/thioredoxin reductase